MTRRLGILLLAWAVVVVAQPMPARAADNAERARVLAASGQAASDAVKYLKAIELFGQAWRLDPQPDYLWRMALAETRADDKEHAMEHFRAFINLAGAERRNIDVAREYVSLLELDFERKRLAKAAAVAAAGDARTAAKLNLTVYQDVRNRWDVLLFHVAMAEFATEQWGPALAHFQEYLSRAPSTAPERGQAVDKVEALRRQARGESVTPTGLAAAAKDAARAARDDAGWTLVRTGVAVTLLGAGSYIWTRDQQAGLGLQLRPDADGQIRGIARSDARASAALLNGHVAVSATLGAVGLVATGLGVQLLWTVAQSPALPEQVTTDVVGKTLLALGGTVALVGAGEYLWTRSEQTELEARWMPGPSGKIASMSLAEARQRTAQVNSQVATALTVGGAGLALAAVGGYVLWRPGQTVAVTPGPAVAGASLSWRF